MIWWLIFEHKGDLHGARFDPSNPLEVQVHWNGAEARTVSLQREYTVAMVRAMSRDDVREGLIRMAGAEVQNIKGLTLHEGELEWDVYFKGRMR